MYKIPTSRRKLFLLEGNSLLCRQQRFGMTCKLMSTLIEKGVEFVSLYFKTLDKDVAPEKISPWLRHIELNRSMMVDKKLRILVRKTS
jgi:hypothetical protein